MAKYISEYGQHWDERVPRAAISWLMMREHVSTSDDNIAANIRSRCTAPGYTESLIKQSIKYALVCHHENQGLYRDVVDGHIGK